jgi:hypothetical protein
METTDDGPIILDEGKHQRCFLKLCEEEMEGCPQCSFCKTLQMGGHSPRHLKAGKRESNGALRKTGSDKRAPVGATIGGDRKKVLSILPKPKVRGEPSSMEGRDALRPRSQGENHQGDQYVLVLFETGCRCGVLWKRHRCPACLYCPWV